MKLIVQKEFYSRVGELVDCFYSFFLMDGTLFSVHRRHRLFSLPNWPASRQENTSLIVLTQYHNRNPKKLESEKILCEGNDPRVVVYKEQAFVISQGALHTNINHQLTLLPSGKTIEIKLGPGVAAGKNWQPFVKDGILFVIDSVAPLRLNQIDVDTGLIAFEREVPQDLMLNAAHDDYSILRGGSNALARGDTLYGWGHATVASFRHVPFIWRLQDNAVMTSFTNIHSYFASHGYNIVDPTSFFSWDEQHFALGLSCSQRDWFHPQWFLNAMLIFKKKDFLKIRPLDFSTGKNRLKRRSLIFHAQELRTSIAARNEFGGLSNNSKKGCLVTGPGKEIDTTRPWTVELCYSSNNRTSRPVGHFDILLQSGGKDYIVASTKIYGTRGKSVRLRLQFDFSNHARTALIHTRVYVGWATQVTAYFFELYND